MQHFWLIQYWMLFLFWLLMPQLDQQERHSSKKQERIGSLQVFFKKINLTQVRYSTSDRELLAIYGAVQFFKHMLGGRHFTIFTDHKPFTFSFKQKPEKASPRQSRHLPLQANLPRIVSIFLVKKTQLLMHFQELKQVKSPLIMKRSHAHRKMTQRQKDIYKPTHRLK